MLVESQHQRTRMLTASATSRTITATWQMPPLRQLTHSVVPRTQLRLWKPQRRCWFPTRIFSQPDCRNQWCHGWSRGWSRGQCRGRCQGWQQGPASDNAPEAEPEITECFKTTTDLALWKDTSSDNITSILIQRGAAEFHNCRSTYPASARDRAIGGKNRHFNNDLRHCCLPNGQKGKRDWIMFSTLKWKYLLFCL